MATTETEARRLSKVGISVFGLYLVGLATGLGVALIRLFDSIPSSNGTLVPSELDLILLVVIVGALGSYVHAATSFASYVGNRRLARSWLWWYLLRPFIGSGLAVIFYFAVRAGLLQSGAGTESLSIFGVAALAGLTGMFSKQATDKLRQLFDNLFSVRDERADKLTKASSPASAESTNSDATSEDTTSGSEADQESRGK